MPSTTAPKASSSRRGRGTTARVAVAATLGAFLATLGSPVRLAAYAVTSHPAGAARVREPTRPAPQPSLGETSCLPSSRTPTHATIVSPHPVKALPVGEAKSLQSYIGGTYSGYWHILDGALEGSFGALALSMKFQAPSSVTVGFALGWNLANGMVGGSSAYCDVSDSTLDLHEVLGRQFSGALPDLGDISYSFSGTIPYQVSIEITRLALHPLRSQLSADHAVVSILGTPAFSQVREMNTIATFETSNNPADDTLTGTFNFVTTGHGTVPASYELTRS